MAKTITDLHDHVKQYASVNNSRVRNDNIAKLRNYVIINSFLVYEALPKVWL